MTVPTSSHILKMMLLWTTILAVLGASSAQKFTVSPEADAGFADFGSKKVRYVIYKINDQNELIEEIEGPRSSSYAEFIASLRKTNPSESRYGTLDYQYVVNGEPKEKLVTFLWSPETASKEEVQKYAFEDKIDVVDKYGIKYYVIAHTDADLDEKTVGSRIKKFSDLAAQVAKDESEETSSAE